MTTSRFQRFRAKTRELVARVSNSRPAAYFASVGVGAAFVSTIKSLAECVGIPVAASNPGCCCVGVTCCCIAGAVHYNQRTTTNSQVFELQQDFKQLGTELGTTQREAKDAQAYCFAREVMDRKSNQVLNRLVDAVFDGEEDNAEKQECLELLEPGKLDAEGDLHVPPVPEEKLAVPNAIPDARPPTPTTPRKAKPQSPHGFFTPSEDFERETNAILMASIPPSGSQKPATERSPLVVKEQHQPNTSRTFSGR